MLWRSCHFQLAAMFSLSSAFLRWGVVTQGLPIGVALYTNLLDVAVDSGRLALDALSWLATLLLGPAVEAGGLFLEGLIRAGVPSHSSASGQQASGKHTAKHKLLLPGTS